jgi:DNA-directed RNA polymerase subunit M
MEFCTECGRLLRPKKEKKTILLVCQGCGFVKKPNEEELLIRSSTKKGKGVIPVIDEEAEKAKLSSINVDCPKCKFPEALWWMVQTRGVDEPMTRFFRCKKCDYTWREYA